MSDTCTIGKEQEDFNISSDKDEDYVISQDELNEIIENSNYKIKDIKIMLDSIINSKKQNEYKENIGDNLGTSKEEMEKLVEICNYELINFMYYLDKSINTKKSDNYCQNWMDKFEKSGDCDDFTKINLYKYKDYNIDFEDDTMLCGGSLYQIEEILQNELVNKYGIYPEGYITNFQGADEEWVHEAITEELMDNETTFADGINESVQKGFHVLQELDTNKRTYLINHISPNFTRKIYDLIKQLLF
ncbi:MAG: hypothetical protein KAJ49_03180 [Arcobacteraceae bacterium]|nr:hypothetical protein [Arcobacteraceae bacterium]